MKKVQVSEVLKWRKWFFSSRDSFPGKLTSDLGFDERASIQHSAKIQKEVPSRKHKMYSQYG